VVGRRCIGLDVHREFAQVAVWEDGQVRHAGQVAITGDALGVFVDSLCPEDEVAIEATCNTHAIVRLIEPRVAQVVVSNPMKTRAIAEANVKTDKVDAAILARLLAADYLPSVWVADEATHALRRQVARRANIVRQRTRLKNQVQAILQRNLIARARPRICSGSRAAAGCQTSRCRQMRSWPSTRCCASSTSTARSCGSSTRHSDGSHWRASRCPISG
jgi:transposase